MNIEILEQIDRYIQLEATGNPKEFAKKLKVSERMVYNYIRFLRSKLDAPVEYSKIKRSYKYAEPGFVDFKWKRKIDPEQGFPFY